MPNYAGFIGSDRGVCCRCMRGDNIQEDRAGSTSSKRSERRASVRSIPAQRRSFYFPVHHSCLHQFAHIVKNASGDEQIDVAAYWWVPALGESDTDAGSNDSDIIAVLGKRVDFGRRQLDEGTRAHIIPSAPAEHVEPHIFNQ